MNLRSDRKTNVFRSCFIKLLIYLTVFSPLIDVKFAHLRIEQIIVLIIILFKVLSKLHEGNLKINKFVVMGIIFAIIISLSALISVFNSGVFSSQYILNFPFKAFLYFIISFEIVNLIIKYLSYDEFIETLFNATFLVALIGIIQFLELRNYIPTKYILNIINTLYPSPGVIDEVFIIKSGGYSIKSGAIGRITSTFEGHPILLGNYFALMIPFLLGYINNLTKLVKWIMMIIALLLTLSRGSIISVVFGLSLYVFLVMFYYKNATAKIIGRYVLLIVVAGAIIYFGGLSTVVWRFEGTIETIIGVGVDEGRITNVWPSVFNHINDVGVSGWIFGSGTNYFGVSDSMYLLILLNFGLIGIITFITIHLLIIKKCSNILSKLKGKRNRYSLFYIGLISSIVTLLINYLVHPIWQGDRFLSAFFLIISYMLLIRGKNSDISENKIPINL